MIGRCPKSCFETDVTDHEEDRHPWRLRQVPVSAVTAPESMLLIAAGSEVDQPVLDREIWELNSAGYSVSGRLYIDASATVLKTEHIDTEKAHGLQERLGSTAKGIGAARVDRLWRTAQTWADLAGEDKQVAIKYGRGVNTAEMMRRALTSKNTAVVIEGTQGYGLGLHTSNYPYVTSGDCRAVDFLAQAGVSPWQADDAGWGVDVKVVVCYRPYPIRVAGNSGELKGETTWEHLGLPVEHTTVTQKVRRVGEWDRELAAAAWRANGGPRGGVVWAALTMMDSVDPELSGLDESASGWTDRLSDTNTGPGTIAGYLSDIGAPVTHLGYVGTGPDTALINERMYD